MWTLKDMIMQREQEGTLALELQLRAGRDVYRTTYSGRDEKNSKVSRKFFDMLLAEEKNLRAGRFRPSSCEDNGVPADDLVRTGFKDLLQLVHLEGDLYARGERSRSNSLVSESVVEEDGGMLSMKQLRVWRELEQTLRDEIDIRAGRDYVSKENKEEVLRIFQERILAEELALYSSRV